MIPASESVGLSHPAPEPAPPCPPPDAADSRDPQAESAQAPAAWHRLFRRRYLVIGIAVFIAATAAGLAMSTLFKGGVRIWPTLRAMRLAPLVALAALIALDWVVGALRLWIFARALRPGFSFFATFRANLANIFLGAITPTQSGGGPAHIYILWRAGLPIAGGTALSVINFVATLLVLFGAAAAVVIWSPHEFPRALQESLRVALAVCGIVIALLIALLLLPSRFFTGADAGGRPDSGGGAGDALTRPEDSRTGPHLTSQRRAAENGAEPTAARSRTAKRLGVKLRQAGQAWGGAVRGCSRDHPETLWQAVLLTLVLYFNKCLMGYVIAVAMGMHAPFWSVMGAQILLIFICYFAPTPGASFIAEISNSYLMGWVAGPEKIVLYTAFVRTSAVWLAVILGGIFLARQLRRDADLWLSRRY